MWRYWDLAQLRLRGAGRPSKRCSTCRCKPHPLVERARVLRRVSAGSAAAYRVDDEIVVLVHIRRVVAVSCQGVVHVVVNFIIRVFLAEWLAHGHRSIGSLVVASGFRALSLARPCLRPECSALRG